MLAVVIVVDNRCPAPPAAAACCCAASMHRREEERARLFFSSASGVDKRDFFSTITAAAGIHPQTGYINAAPPRLFCCSVAVRRALLMGADALAAFASRRRHCRRLLNQERPRVPSQPALSSAAAERR